MKSFQAARWFTIAAVSILIGVLSFAPTASAIAYHYTFEGTTIANDDYDPSPPNDWPGEEPVSYTFLIDFGRTGSQTILGVDTPMVDSGGYDYFYVEFVSGTHVYPRPAANPTDNFSENYGFDHSSTGSEPWTAGFIFGTPTNFSFNSVVISSGAKVSTWEIGDIMIGEDSVRAADSADGIWVVSNLELVSIASVPEPSTMLLLGTGLLGIVGLNRRRKA